MLAELVSSYAQVWHLLFALNSGALGTCTYCSLVLRWEPCVLLGFHCPTSASVCGPSGLGGQGCSELESALIAVIIQSVCSCVGGVL